MKVKLSNISSHCLTLLTTINYFHNISKIKEILFSAQVVHDQKWVTDETLHKLSDPPALSKTSLVSLYPCHIFLPISSRSKHWIDIRDMIENKKLHFEVNWFFRKKTKCILAWNGALNTLHSRTSSWHGFHGFRQSSWAGGSGEFVYIVWLSNINYYCNFRNNFKNTCFLLQHNIRDNMVHLNGLLDQCIFCEPRGSHKS